MSFPLVEPQRRKELPARGPTSDMMGVYTWALAVLLHMAEGGIQIPEVEIQGVRALGGGRGALPGGSIGWTVEFLGASVSWIFSYIFCLNLLRIFRSFFSPALNN